MIIRFSPNIDDIMAFHKDYYSSSRQLRKQVTTLRILYLIIAVFLAWYAIEAISDGGSWTNPAFMAMVALSLLSLLFGIFIDRRLMAINLRRARKSYVLPGNSIYFEPVEMEFGDNGISIRREAGESTSCWNAVIKVSETPCHYFVYVSEISANIIPKRILTKDEDSELKRILDKHVRSKK